MVDDAHHALDLPWSYGSSARLLPQQVHHVSGELCARLAQRGTRETEKKTRKTSLIYVLARIYNDISNYEYHEGKRVLEILCEINWLKNTFSFNPSNPD